MTFLGLQARGRARALILGVFALIGVVSQAGAARTELDLGGSWQYQNVSQLNYPPSNNWQTITSGASITSWEDNGSLSGTPPMSPTASQRFYRIRQVSP